MNRPGIGEHVDLQPGQLVKQLAFGPWSAQRPLSGQVPDQLNGVAEQIWHDAAHTGQSGLAKIAGSFLERSLRLLRA